MGTGHAGQYSGKIRLNEKPGVQIEGVVLWLNVVLTPGKPTLKSNFRDGSLCKLWVLLPPLPHWGRYPRKIRFIEPHVGNGHR